VKGDGSTGNMAWYGVIKKIITLDFPLEKEVVLFECDWYDVPATTTSKSKGYNKDEYGIIDIDTRRHRYSGEPYILATQAELVFYAEIPNKLGWCSVVAVKPRNLYAMPEAIEDEGQLDTSLLDVGVQDMNQTLHQRMDLTNWRRSDMEGSSGDASIINQALANLFLNQITRHFLRQKMMRPMLMMELWHQLQPWEKDRMTISLFEQANMSSV
jgi:hypothetical protein